MICVYDRDNTAFDKNGDAVLIPLKCTHRQVAAGKYDLSMTHPIDPYGKWMHLVPEAVIRAPVPHETIDNAYSGQEVDVYRTTSNGAALRSGPSEPTTISYPSWDITATYSVGSKVTFSGQNYECTYYDANDNLHAHLAPSGCSWWTKIANKTAGSPVLVNLKKHTELYYIDGPDDGWYKMSLPYGLEGYIKSSQVEYVRHQTPDETQSRTITTQLFRIRTVGIDTKQMTVSVTAEHVSYDLSGVLVKDVKIVDKNVAITLGTIEASFMIDYQGMIATDMTKDSNGLYKGEIKGKNGIYALLDPDKGVVATVKAMYRRDNWDLFVMKRKTTDRGFRLRYGKNMLGVTWNIKSDSLVTRVVPVAKAADGSDLYLDNDPWVDSPLINDYPVIRMERLKVNGQVGKDDGSETATNWTESTLREEMEKKAQDRFDKQDVDKVIHEITVDFVMLGDTVEYRDLKNMQQVLMYDTVIAVNEEIGLSVSVEVTEIEFDCIRETITALKLSNVKSYGSRNVSGFNVFNNSITDDKLTDEVGSNIIESATSDSNDYTDTQVRTMNTSIRAWVQNNFQPIGS